MLISLRNDHKEHLYLLTSQPTQGIEINPNNLKTNKQFFSDQRFLQLIC